jgi:hypothetical protein
MNKMKTIILATALTVLTFGAVAEELSLEDRVSKLEDKSLGLPNGFFINGEIEGYYDDKTYDSGWDSRGELQFGVETSLPDNELNIDWVGGTTTIDSHYALNTADNNKLVEKQLGFGNDTARIYIGETDAQRMGFAKTPKISAPLIYTETNYRIDHREKTVLTFGGWQYDNEFDFDSHRLSRDVPWGVALAYDNNNNVYYGTATVDLGLAEVSYMHITGPEDTNKDDQQGYAIGGSLHRFGVPMLWGVELWDDKNTGTYTEDDRLDYGVMYNVSEAVYVTAHRTENDDLGYDGNYYGVVYNLVTDYDSTKRADKQDGLEVGLYYHDKEQTNIATGAYTDHGSQFLASVRYKF